MSDFISDLLLAIVTAAVPVLTAAAVNYLLKKSGQVAAQTENETLAHYISEAADAVATAVSYTSQTYVDSLKESGSFDTEAQKKALSMALEKAKALLSESAVEILGDIYGDLTDYLTTKIEQEVKTQKAFAVTTATAVLTETSQTTDVAAVAAATAAVTAATVVKTPIAQTSTAETAAQTSTRADTPSQDAEV